MTRGKSWLASSFEELSGRKVFRAAGAYAVTAWLLTEVSATVLPLFGASDAVLRAIVIVAVAGFPVAMVLAWAYDFSSDGITRTRKAAPVSGGARRLDIVIIAVLLAVVGYLLYDRFATPAVTAPAATTPATTDAAGLRPSIAVLPFQNISTDPANEVFGDGLAEDLLNRLARLEGLHVAARTSAFRFRDKQVDIREIGEALDVETVLEGSVQAAGDRIKVSAQLIRASTGYNMWSGSYSRRLTDVFAIQDEISRAVAENLELALLGTPEVQEEAEPTANIDAYRLYLRGRIEWHKRTSSSLEKARELFQAAIDLDPEYAAAWSGLADAYNFLANYGNLAQDEAIARSEAAARRALELDPDLDEAHASLGLVYLDQMRFKQAADQFARAVELNPNFAMARTWLGSAVAWVDEERGLEEHRRAVELDLLSPIANQALGRTLYNMGRTTEAKEQYLRITEFAPEYPLVYFNLAEIAANENDYEAAVGYLRKANELDPGRAATLTVLALTYVGLGDIVTAREWIEKAEAIGPDQIAVIRSRLDLLYVAGDWDGIELLVSEKLVRPQDAFVASVYRSLVAYGQGKFALAARILEGVFANIAAKQPTPSEEYVVADQTMYGLLYMASALERSGERDKALGIAQDLIDYLDARRARGIHRDEYLVVRAGTEVTRGNKDAAIDAIRQLAERGWPGYVRLENDRLFAPLRNELEYKLSIDFIRKNAQSHLARLNQAQE